MKKTTLITTMVIFALLSLGFTTPTLAEETASTITNGAGAVTPAVVIEAVVKTADSVKQTSENVKETVEKASETSTNVVDVIDKHLDKAGNAIASVAPKVKAVLEQLADQLAIGVEHVYGVFVTQKLYEGVGGLIMVIVQWSLAALALHLAFRFKGGKSDNLKFDNSVSKTFLIAATFIGLLALLDTAFGLKGDIIRIANPEYYVIQDIVDMTEKLTKAGVK